MSLPKKNIRSRLESWVDDKRELFQDEVRLAGRHKILHFFYLIFRNFDENRCLSRAGAMTFSTILAIVPTLAIVIGFAPRADDVLIRKIITTGIEYFAPTLEVKVNTQPMANIPGETNTVQSLEPDSHNIPEHDNTQSDSSSVFKLPNTNRVELKEQIVNGILEFIRNFESARYSVFGFIAFLSMVFSTLITIESVMNDIWDSDRGRPWPSRLMSYWVVITFSGLFITGAGLLLGFRDSVHALPGGPYLSAFGVIIFISLALTALYRLMPNASVKWFPALVGGVTGALLLQLNKMFIPLFISGRAERDGQIYGSFLALTLFMFGIYIAWVIVLFGAQVAATFQNRRAYLHGIQSKNIHQYGRESAAVKIMSIAARHFDSGKIPPSVPEIARSTGIPEPLIQEIVDILIHHRLLQIVGIGTNKSAISPARPIETITCFDILDATRKAKGHNLNASNHNENDASSIIDPDLQNLHHFHELDKSNTEKVTLQELIHSPSNS